MHYIRFDCMKAELGERSWLNGFPKWLLPKLANIAEYQLECKQTSCKKAEPRPFYIEIFKQILPWWQAVTNRVC